METQRFEIDSDASLVAGVSQAIYALAEKVGGADFASETEIAVCEAINNVIEHAYRFESGNPVVVEWQADDDHICIKVHDFGCAMPAGAVRSVVPEFDPDDPSTLPEGGFGLGLINAIMDRVDYDTDASGRNTLELSRRLPG